MPLLSVIRTQHDERILSLLVRRTIPGVQMKNVGAKKKDNEEEAEEAAVRNALAVR